MATVTIHGLLTAWQTAAPSWVSLAVALAFAFWYLWSARRLGRRGRRWSGWRTAAFLGGVALVAVAVQSGLASYDDSDFAAHVVQHLLLMNFAPILFALAAPTTLALQASSRRTQQGLLKVLHHPVVSAVTHPAVVAALSYGTMLVYFLTPLYRLSIAHPVLHDLTHLHFLLSGCLFWWAVVGLDPSRWRLSYAQKLAMLGAGVPVTAILGLALTGARTSVAPVVHSVADTHAGGSILWVAGELTTLVAMAIIVVQWLAYEERKAERADRILDAQAARDAEVARAAHGAGADLR